MLFIDTMYLSTDYDGYGMTYQRAGSLEVTRRGGREQVRKRGCVAIRSRLVETRAGPMDQ